MSLVQYDGAIPRHTQDLRPVIMTCRSHGKQLPMLAEIKAAVAVQFKVSILDLMSNRRERNLACARHVYAYLAKTMTTKTFLQIGQAIDKDRTTVLYAYEKIRDDVARYAASIEGSEKALKAILAKRVL